MATRRMKQLNVRMTESEYVLLEQYAANSNLSVAEFVRKRCLLPPGSTPPGYTTPVETISELSEQLRGAKQAIEIAQRVLGGE